MKSLHVYESSRDLCRQMGPQKYVSLLQEALRTGKAQPQKVDLECEFDAIAGPYWRQRLHESATDTLASDFQYAFALGREVMDATIQEAYGEADTPIHRLIPERSVSGPGVDGGWESLVASHSPESSSLVDEGEPAIAQTLDDFAVMRPKVKFRHRMVSLTAETRIRDDLNQVTDAAARIGEEMAYEAETDCLRHLMGLENVYQDSENGATDSYQTSSPWDNTAASNEIADYTNLDAIRELLSQAKHPATGKSLGLHRRMRHLLVMPQRYSQVRNVITAQEVTAITASGEFETTSGNPYANQFEVFVDSPIAYDLLVASGVSASDAVKHSFCGDFTAFMRRAVAQPLQVAQGSGTPSQRVEIEWHATWAFAHYPVLPAAVVKSL